MSPWFLLVPIKHWTGSGGFWELSHTCTPAVGLCVSPSHPFHPSVGIIPSSKFLLKWFQPWHSGIGQRNFSMGYSKWHRVVSESFPAHPLHAGVPLSVSFATKANTKSFYLLSPSSFFFPTFQFISCSMLLLLGCFIQWTTKSNISLIIFIWFYLFK